MQAYAMGIDFPNLKSRLHLLLCRFCNLFFLLRRKVLSANKTQRFISSGTARGLNGIKYGNIPSASNLLTPFWMD